MNGLYGAASPISQIQSIFCLYLQVRACVRVLIYLCVRVALSVSMSVYLFFLSLPAFYAFCVCFVCVSVLFGFLRFICLLFGLFVLFSALGWVDKD